MGKAAAALGLCCVIGMTPLAHGDAVSERLIDDALVAEIRDLVASPVVAFSLRTANTQRDGMDVMAIKALDDQWRGEVEAPRQPLVATMLSSPLSNYLTRVQAHSGGLFTEIFIVGRLGLNVGQSAVTSDMWQGDEAKFQRTFLNGPNTIFVDAAEYHEPSGTWRAQLNLTVDDPDGGAPLGAATFEINLTELTRRKNQ